ncbi:MAG: fluoride efflux transporter CrcB [Muribaculaceae bacterium]|nr:fluoride efflux transporter CrcB [Muribaculaceae bacterium]
MLKLMLLAGVGGFFGTCCRFLTNRLYLTYFQTSLPLATFTVNMLGCLILGLVLGLMNKAGVMSPKINAFLIVGFCGGFTTFSTFSYETFSMGMNGETLVSLLYVVGSIFIGLLAVWLGFIITR